MGVVVLKHREKFGSFYISFPIEYSVVNLVVVFVVLTLLLIPIGVSVVNQVVIRIILTPHLTPI